MLAPFPKTLLRGPLVARTDEWIRLAVCDSVNDWHRHSRVSRLLELPTPHPTLAPVD